MSSSPLPDGTRLLHIGPHKTGTTALQIALAKHSSDLLAQGVRYLSEGPRVNANYAAFALEGRSSRKIEGGLPVPIRHWESLRRNASTASERIVLMSGEEFCVLSEQNVKSVIEEFGRERVHILVTLRPLVRILGSQWQQHIQGGKMRRSLDVWLHEVLDQRDSAATTGAGFWKRHRHDELIARWAAAVGEENISVMILDDSDHDFLPRSVEQLLGLRPGTIGIEERVVNRSLTMEETEAIRSFYALMQDQGYVDMPDHIRYMVSPAEYMKRHRKPLATESKIRLPDWAAERAYRINQEMVESIQRSRVHIIGNFAHLLKPPTLLGPAASEPITVLPLDLAGWTTLGALEHSRVVEGELPLPKQLSQKQMRRATGPQLAKELLRRIRLRIVAPQRKKDKQESTQTDLGEE